MNRTEIAKRVASHKKNVKNERNYWLNKLSGELGPTHFLYDNIVQDASRYQTDKIQFKIKGDLFSRLNHLTNGSENNLYIVLMSCLVILLNKYTGNKDIIIAAPIYKQDIEGEFVNTVLAIRNQLTGEELLKELIMQSKTTLFEANEHLNYPIERLLKDLELQSSGNGPSLFETVLLLENIHHRKYIEHLKPNILLSFLQSSEYIEGVLEYNSLLYRNETVRNIARHFVHLLREMVNNLAIQVSGIEILLDEEKYQMLMTFNETHQAFPENKTINELFEEQAARTPDHIALVGEIPNKEESFGHILNAFGGMQLSYRELNEKSNQLAKILMERGVKTGTIVAVMAAPSVMMIIGMMAILKAGCTYLPIDPGFPIERINYMLADSHTHLILSQNHFMDHPVSVKERINIEDNTIYKGEAANLKTASTPEDVVYVIYTSGTSGKPKGVLVKHVNLVNYIYWFSGKARITGKDKSLLLSSFAFDLGYTSIYSAILEGVELHIIPKESFLSPGVLLNYIKEKGITYIKLTPSLFSTIVNSPDFSRETCASLRLVVLGGEAINVKDIEKAHSLCSHMQMMNHYGPTEATIGSVAAMVDFDQFESYRNNPVIGTPIANTRVYILDKEFRLLPIGVPGELCIAGTGTARGYLNRPEFTADKFKRAVIRHSSFVISSSLKTNDPPTTPFPNDQCPMTNDRLYHTGDLARWMMNGNIDFLGRIDSQVKIRGFRIELGEIENLLLEYPGIKDAVVILKESINRDKYLCAYITSLTKVSAVGLREFLAKELPDYMIPSYFVHLDELPLTHNGKVNMRALPEPDIKKVVGVNAAPRNQVEEKMAKIWSSILQIKKDSLGIDDNFFELGGHSLRATVMISNIHQEFSVKLPLGELFKSPTVRQLAAYIGDAQKSIFKTIVPVERKEYYQQSSAQKRLFFLEQFEHIGTTYNIPRAIIIDEKIDKKKFKNTVKALIARHETLRTSLALIENTPIQRVYPTVDFKIKELQCHQPNIEEIVNDFVRPFDLSRAPLLRVGISKLPDGKFLLLFDMHHIISDGTSMDILVGDFARLYNGDVPIPLKVHYKDFSRWQNDLFTTGRIKAQEKYWLDLYSDKNEIPKLDLPTDYTRPTVFRFEGADYYFDLDEKDSIPFKRNFASHNVTIFMNLLAAYNVLLFKYTGQEVIIVGCDIAGRPHPDLEPIIGMFVNELAMRNCPEEQKNYIEFLNEVKENSINAFENQDYQFEELVDKLDLERDVSRNPLFDVEFVVQNVERSKTSVEGISARSYGYENKTTKFDIALDAYELGEAIKFRFQYSTGLFKRRTIESMAKHFLNIIKEVTQNPGIRLGHINMICKNEKQQMLFEFNNTKKDLGEHQCFTHLFERQMEKTPGTIAVSYKNESLSYGELDKRANQLANYLFYEKNIHPNERVAVWMDRSVNFLVAILGIMKAGGAYIPIVPDLPEERIKKIIDDAEIMVVISEEKYDVSVNWLQWECPTFQTFLSMDSEDCYSLKLKEEEKIDLKTTEELWNYVVKIATDDITEGGWLSSYTGEPFTKEEMDEYGDNILKKLGPLLHKGMGVLEIGCASGITMYRIAPRVGLYYGTDISRETIEKNKQRLKEIKSNNIYLECLPAHEIDKINKRDFDLIIINSVIQSFHGHNYLRDVLRKAVDLLAEKAYLFIGDIMDQDLKQDLIHEMMDFKQANKGKSLQTKIDWSTELFVSRAFFQDLAADIPGIQKVKFSPKNYTIENELTKFRYDTLLTIDKTSKGPLKVKQKHKYQNGLKDLNQFDIRKVTTPSSSDDLAYVIYTSGTTGQPKGVLIHQRGMINHLYAKINDLSITGEDIIAQTASAGFDISVWQFLAALIVGGVTLIIDKETILESLEFLEVLQQRRVTILESVPSLMTAFFEGTAQERRETLHHLRWMIFTGEPLTPPLVKKWYRHYPGIKLVNAYGPTEASDDVTHHIVDQVPPETQTSIPIGKPLQNLHIYILDKNLSLCPVGVKGEICVAGIGVGKGYWKDTQKTKRAFIPNPFLQEIGDKDYAIIYKTGDIGYFKADGTIECLGRLDHQVKIRGNRIELGEIERQLLKHEEIKEAVVIAKEGKREDKYLCAYIVSTRTEGLEDLREFLSKELPDYMIPTYFIPIEKISLTPNGKIDRKALPDPGLKTNREYIAPRNEVEVKLAEMWGEVLGIGQDIISIDANFFQLGGHSLKVTILVARIRKEFDVKIPLAEIFNTPTIKGIASLINVYNWSDEKKVDIDEKMEEIVI